VPDVRGQAANGLTGQGVTIAVLDTGIDGTHPDLPYGSKLTGNVRLNGSIPGGVGFIPPSTVENVTNTDLVLGHGTFVASVAAGTGQASGGLYAGVAPGASVLGLSAGDVFIVNMLEGFDYVLDHAQAMNIRVVNCSWGTQGWFDPDDPVNVASRALSDAGISVVFAAGNHGPSPDTLNPYAVAPWVIGVASPVTVSFGAIGMGSPGGGTSGGEEAGPVVAAGAVAVATGAAGRESTELALWGSPPLGTLGSVFGGAFVGEVAIVGALIRRGRSAFFAASGSLAARGVLAISGGARLGFCSTFAGGSLM